MNNVIPLWERLDARHFLTCELGMKMPTNKIKRVRVMSNDKVEMVSDEDKV